MQFFPLPVYPEGHNPQENPFTPAGGGKSVHLTPGKHGGPLTTQASSSVSHSFPL